LTGIVLHRPTLIFMTIVSGGLESKVRVGKMGPGERHYIGPASRNDRVDLIPACNIAYGNCWDFSFQSDLL